MKLKVNKLVTLLPLASHPITSVILILSFSYLCYVFKVKLNMHIILHITICYTLCRHSHTASSEQHVITCFYFMCGITCVFDYCSSASSSSGDSSDELVVSTKKRKRSVERTTAEELSESGN